MNPHPDVAGTLSYSLAKYLFFQVGLAFGANFSPTNRKPNSGCNLPLPSACSPTHPLCTSTKPFSTRSGGAVLCTDGARHNLPTRYVMHSSPVSKTPHESWLLPHMGSMSTTTFTSMSLTSASLSRQLPPVSKLCSSYSASLTLWSGKTPSLGTSCTNCLLPWST